MATTSPSQASATSKTCLFERHIKPFLTPYYFIVAAVLGAITAVFGALTVALILIVANFNILSWIFQYLTKFWHRISSFTYYLQFYSISPLKKKF